MSEKKGTVLDVAVSEGDWFDFFESRIDLESGEIIYDEPQPDAGRVRFRSTLPFIREHEEMREICGKFVLNSKTRAMDHVEYKKPRTAEERKQFNDDMCDYAITGIESFFDAEGNALECTRENKLALIKVPVFDRFMARCLELQVTQKTEHEAAIEKNSTTP